MSRIVRSIQLAGLIAVIACTACAKTVAYDPSAPATFYYEQTRAVGLSIFQFNLNLREVLKYRQEIVSVGENEIEMRFTPLDYRVTATNREGVQNIFGTSLLQQSDEGPEVKILRAYGQHPIDVRVSRAGRVLKLRADPAAFPAGVGRDALIARTEQQLQQALVEPHLMLTQAVMPIEKIQVGESYKPAGYMMDLENDEFGPLMKVESMTDAGLATLRIDSSIVAKLLNKAKSTLNLPKDLDQRLDFHGDGAGTFLYDTKRQCMKEGSVNVTAEARPSAPNVAVNAVTVRLSFSLREIPEP
ncbi:MAG: hypothetical protein KJ042_10590 [Deltaproteobacteria bacterium]|nr:hypothetical protein [Deltaproteobacteria bacterium]